MQSIEKSTKTCLSSSQLLLLHVEDILGYG